MLELTGRIVDLEHSRVITPEGEVTLTTNETVLLKVLAARPGIPVPREDLLEAAGYSRTSGSRTIDARVHALRKKLELDPKHPRHLLTVHGEGYNLVLAPTRPPIPVALASTPDRPMSIPGGLIDLDKGMLTRGGRSQSLTKKEVQLLLFLSRQPDGTASRDDIGWALWRRKTGGGLDQLLRRLRLKLETDPKRPEVLTTGRGVGIRLNLQEAPQTPGFVTEFFVGRVSLLDRAQESLGEHRLTVLYGPGGMGKTQLAHRIAQSRPTAWADLSRASDPNEALAVVARTLGLDDPNEIGNALRGEARLLVLDNLEPWLEALLSDLRRWVEESKAPLLVTSRVQVPLQAAFPIEVGPLSPEESRTLFTHLARRARADVVLDDASIDAICIQLDRMPLAIELAAARLQRMSLEQLRNGFQPSRLKARDDRPERHRTLEALFQDTWNDLSDPEKDALAGFAVFVGGFQLESAEAVVGPEAEDRVDALMDNGWLRWHRGRFDILATVRAFAIEHATVSHHRRHALHFASMGESEEALFDSLERTSGSTLRLETANLWAALRWLEEQGEIEAASDAAAALGRLLQESGPFESIRESIEVLVAQADFPRLGCLLAELELRRGDADLARTLARELLPETTEPFLQTRLRWLIARTYLATGNYESSLEEAMLALDHAAIRQTPGLMRTVGDLHTHLGDPDQAERWARRAGEAARRSGERKTELEAEVVRGGVARLRGRFHQAKLIFREVREAALGANLLPTAQRAQMGLAGSHHERGELEQARKEYSLADEMLAQWQPTSPRRAVARYFEAEVRWEQAGRVLTPELAERLEAATQTPGAHIGESLRILFARVVSSAGEHQRALELIAGVQAQGLALAACARILAQGGRPAPLDRLLHIEAAERRRLGATDEIFFLCCIAETAFLSGKTELTTPRLAEAQRLLDVLDLLPTAPAVREARSLESLLAPPSSETQ